MISSRYCHYRDFCPVDSYYPRFNNCFYSDDHQYNYYTLSESGLDSLVCVGEGRVRSGRRPGGKGGEAGGMEGKIYRWKGEGGEECGEVERRGVVKF